MSTKKAIITYKAMSQELDSVMASFDDPNIDIEQSVKLYRRAMELIKQIEHYLNTVQNKIEEPDNKVK